MTTQESETERLLRLLNEANLRADQERRAREDAEQARDDAEQARDDAEQARENEKLRADQEQMARQDAEQAQEDAEQARENEKLRADQEQVARQDAESRNQNTSFLGFLQACHNLLHVPLTIETNKSWTTKGFTSPAKKYYPKTLKPWEDFPRLQQEYFKHIYEFFHPADMPAPRAFIPIAGVKIIGEEYCKKKLANEAGLRYYENIALERPVERIVNELQKSEGLQSKIYLGEGIAFENYASALSDADAQVQSRAQMKLPQTPPSVSHSFSSSSSDRIINSQSARNHADQYCVYKKNDGTSQLLFLVEYKPPHKLSVGMLQAGFREMDLKQEVIDCPFSPAENEVEARLQHNAEKLVAAVATQTFHYMIQNGLEYSYISTGEALVFLRIKKKDPTTLYFHVSEPGRKIFDDERHLLHHHTAVSQVVSLTLMAAQSKQRGHKWQSAAKKSLKKWEIDYENVLSQIPETERKRVSDSIYKGRKHSALSRSPYNTRKKARRNSADNFESLKNRQHEWDTSPEPESPSARRARTIDIDSSLEKEAQGGSKNKKQYAYQSNYERQYCTQKCLLGLVNRSQLDKNCPNTHLHSRLGKRHAISRSELLDLTQKQLAEDLDDHCSPLGLEGARGALFKITLVSHGYVFVGKGTVRVYVPDLKYEGKVYQKLGRLQGKAVPVYLGSINLRQWYNLHPGVRILFMFFMSYGGRTIEESEMSRLQSQIQQTVSEVRQLGIDQYDIRWPNLLWNSELNRIMLIDFEGAKFFTRQAITSSLVKGKVLQDISRNQKRKRNEDESNGDPEKRSAKKPLMAEHTYEALEALA